MSQAELLNDWEERYRLLKEQYNSDKLTYEAVVSQNKKLCAIYHAANELLGELGARGEIAATDSIAGCLMDAMIPLDNGIYNPKLGGSNDAEPATPPINSKG